jgi:hypothetical protein
MPGSQRANVAMNLRHRYISQKREAVIGVKIPLYEGRQGDPAPPSESTPWDELFSPSPGQGRSLIGTSNMFPSPDSTWRNFLPAFTGCSLAAAPRISLHTSTTPVGVPSTAFLWSALKEESIIKGAHVLAGSLAQVRICSKLP